MNMLGPLHIDHFAVRGPECTVRLHIWVRRPS